MNRSAEVNMNEGAAVQVREIPAYLNIKDVLTYFPLTKSMVYEAVEKGWWPNWRKPGRVVKAKATGKRIYRDGKRWMGPAADIIAWLKKFDSVKDSSPVPDGGVA